MPRRILPSLLLALLTVRRWPGLLRPNFSPVYALAFCAGVYLPGRLAWWLPLSVLLFTDVLLNAHCGASLVSGWLALNYVAYACPVGLGRMFSARSSWLHLLAGGLCGAVVFYLITNTAAWLNPLPGPYPQTPYPRTVLGWVQTLTVGASHPPTWTFFRNTLWSSGIFTGLFVAGMKFTESANPSLAEAGDQAREEAPEPEPETAS